MTTLTQSKAIPFAFAKRHGVLVLEWDNGVAKIIYHGKPSITALAEIRRHLNIPIEMTEVNEEAFGKLLVKTYETDSSIAMQMVEDMGEEMDLFHLMQELPKSEDLLETQDDAPIIRLLNALLSEAIKEGASDVHIETFENRVLVRFRVDGVLREVLEPQRVLAPLIVSRIKVMAKLDMVASH
jgi:general secretion pathway protein E